MCLPSESRNHLPRWRTTLHRELHRSYREYLKKTPIPTHVYTCMYYVPASRKRPARSRTSTTAPCSTRPPGAHPLHGHEVPRDPCGLRRLVLEKNAEARASVANPDCSAPLCTVTISKLVAEPTDKTDEPQTRRSLCSSHPRWSTGAACLAAPSRVHTRNKRPGEAGAWCRSTGGASRAAGEAAADLT